MKNYNFSKDYELLYSLIMEGYKVITMTFNGVFVDDFIPSFESKHAHLDSAQLTKSFDSKVFDGFRLFYNPNDKSKEGSSTTYYSHCSGETWTLEDAIKDKFMRICEESRLHFLPINY